MLENKKLEALAAIQSRNNEALLTILSGINAEDEKNALAELLRSAIHCRNEDAIIILFEKGFDEILNYVQPGFAHPLAEALDRAAQFENGGNIAILLCALGTYAETKPATLPALYLIKKLNSYTQNKLQFERVVLYLTSLFMEAMKVGFHKSAEAFMYARSKDLQLEMTARPKTAHEKEMAQLQKKHAKYMNRQSLTTDPIALAQYDLLQGLRPELMAAAAPVNAPAEPEQINEDVRKRLEAKRKKREVEGEEMRNFSIWRATSKPLINWLLTDENGNSSFHLLAALGDASLIESAYTAISIANNSSLKEVILFQNRAGQVPADYAISRGTPPKNIKDLIEFTEKTRTEIKKSLVVEAAAMPVVPSVTCVAETLFAKSEPRINNPLVGCLQKAFSTNNRVALGVILRNPRLTVETMEASLSGLTMKNACTEEVEKIVAEKKGIFPSSSMRASA